MLHGTKNRLRIEPLKSSEGVEWGRRSFAHIDVEGTPRTACVFIHGWSGDPNETWFGFPSSTINAGYSADFIYYGYDSLRKTAAFSAAQLRKFLGALLTAPVANLFGATAGPQQLITAARGEPFQYRRVVLCCHSLGAVIARRALLDLETELPSIVSGGDIRMLLFAPAHSGSELAKLAQELFSVGILRLPLAVAGTLARVKLRSLKDLVPGSQTLKDLAADNQRMTAAIVARSGKPPTFLPRVLHADNDDVVEQNDFPGDPPFQPVMQQTHSSICKPTASYVLPFTELASFL